MTFPAFHDRVGRNIKAFCPTALSQAFSIPFDPNVGSTVGSLFLKARPSAIVGRVIPVVVDSIKRMPMWPSSHVGKEACEVMSPEWADRNSSTSIVRELSAIRVLATIDHLRPRDILAAFSSAMSLSQLTVHIAQEATARARVFVSQGMAGYHLLFSALATAQPEGKSRSQWRFFGSADNGETTEYLSGKFQWAH